MLEIGFYLVLGVISGLLAGLLGIGGGVIGVPGLAYIFKYLNMPPQNIMHMATSTSLACIVITTGTAVLTHWRRGNIDWKTFWNLAPGIILGILLGTITSTYLPNKALKLLFGIFLLLVSFLLILKPAPPENTSNTPNPNKWFIKIAGMMVGFLGGILGVGGGIFIIPVLLYFGITAHRAMATSSACAFLLSLIGTISFIVLGWHLTSLPTGSTGFIYWPAVLGIALTSIVFVPLGAKLARRLPANTLKNIFAGFLVLVGIDMIIF